MELIDNAKRKKRTKTDKSKVPNGEREGKVRVETKAVVGKRVCWGLGVVIESQCGSYGTNSVLSLLPVDHQVSCPYLSRQGQRKLALPRDL